MASGLMDTRRGDTLSWLFRNQTDTPTSPSATEANVYVVLTSASTTASAIGTVITAFDGATDGKLCDWNAPSAGVITATGPDAAGVFRWDLTSGGPVSIAGAVVHSNGSTNPTLETQGICFVNGLSYTIQDGEGFEIADQGVTFTLANTA